MKTYKGTVSRLENVYKHRPSVNSKQIAKKEAGEFIDISHAIKGEKHRGEDTWYVLTDNTYMWSGVIYTPVPVPLIKKTLIVTADDVGIVKEIDDGAQEALKMDGSIRLLFLSITIKTPKLRVICLHGTIFLSTIIAKESAKHCTRPHT